MYTGYIPITSVIERLGRNPMFKDFSEADIIDYAVEAIDLISNNDLFDYASKNLQIESYRAPIPQDCREIVGIKLLYKGTGSTTTIESTIPNADGDVPSSDPTFMEVHTPNYTTSGSSYGYGVNMRYGTDKFQVNFSNFANSLKGVEDATVGFTYVTKGNYLHTSTESGVCNIFYKTRLMDEEGVLLMPDSASFMRALETHIKLRLFENLMIYDGYVQNLETDYYFYIGKAQAEQHKKSDDELMGIANMVNTLYRTDDAQETDFRNITAKEYINKH